MESSGHAQLLPKQTVGLLPHYERCQSIGRLRLATAFIYSVILAHVYIIGTTTDSLGSCIVFELHRDDTKKARMRVSELPLLSLIVSTQQVIVSVAT